MDKTTLFINLSTPSHFSPVHAADTEREILRLRAVQASGSLAAMGSGFSGGELGRRILESCRGSGEEKKSRGGWDLSGES